MSFQSMANREPIPTAEELAKIADEKEQQAIFDKILDTAEAAGVEMTLKSSYGWLGRDVGVTIENEEYLVTVNVERSKTGVGYYRRQNGPYRVVVGSYGEVVAYPHGKNGLNFQKIVAQIKKNAEGQAANKRRNEQIEKDRLANAAALLRLTGNQWGSYFLRAEKGQLVINATVTEEQAEKFLALAVELGLVKQP